jgi:hypothetical protein
MTFYAASEYSLKIGECRLVADSVEKLGIRTKTMAAASRLARGDLLDVPSSV